MSTCERIFFDKIDLQRVQRRKRSQESVSYLCCSVLRFLQHLSQLFELLITNEKNKKRKYVHAQHREKSG
jgi:hypothetical protein